MANTCILDIGANQGEFILALATRLPTMACIGIEPIPELFNILEQKRIELGLSQLRFARVAIDEVARHARFNVARHADLGVSSLLSFDTASVQQNDYWQRRTDLYFDEEIEVDVVRLDTLLEAAGVEHVSFIKIDAQGVDLKVLASLGKYLDRTDGGMLEVSTTRNSVLYQDEPLLHEVLDFLDRHEFEPYAIKSNDPANAEVNVFFIRKGLDWREMEQRLQLRGIALYDGRHYWHIPSAGPELPPEAAGPIAHNEVAQARHLRAENAATWARVMHWKSEMARLNKRNEELIVQLAAQKLATRLPHLAAPAPLEASASMTAEIARLRHNEQVMQTKIGDLLSSTSWRVTAPLRALKSFISR